MRVSSAGVFNQGVTGMQNLQQELTQTQQQISTGKRVVTPADDPVAAAQALLVTQTQAEGAQYATNQKSASGQLGIIDNTMTSISNLYQAARTTLVQAGDASLSNSDRASLANTLQSDLQQLLTLANTTDGSGNYLFSGNKVQTAPYAQTATGATYQGDQGQLALQVSTSRTIAIGQNGAGLFDRVPTGNGVFATSATGTNTGSGTIAPGSVTDPTQLTGHNYQLQFHGPVNSLTYDVVDTTTGTSLSVGTPYVPGQSIPLPGMQVSVSGTPQAGDSFNIKPSTNQSVFTTLQQAITTLQTPTTTAAQRAQLSQTLSQAISGMDNAASTIQAAHTKVGASEQELTSLTAANTDMNVAYTQQLSDLQDVDYTTAISNLNAQQLALQATQQSFANISKLSLFNFIQ